MFLKVMGSGGLGLGMLWRSFLSLWHLNNLYKQTCERCRQSHPMFGLARRIEVCLFGISNTTSFGLNETC
jgi:hypothetical protein